MRKLLPQISLITILILAIGFFVVPQEAGAAPRLFECGADITCWLFGSANTLYGWLAKIFWWGLIPLAGLVFSTVGLVVDEALRLSLDGTFYNAEAIGTAWSVIRDIANMLFIFILIYEGIRTILNLGNLVTVRKTITSVIIAALFLNFSLFFTKVVIDVSNISAAWFMQGITKIGQNESVSLSIGSTLNMNKLASKYKGDTQKDLEQIGLQSFATGAILFVLMCVAIYVFFNFLFLVIGRIVAFIFLLITAPIGFVGALVPMLQDYSKKWWKELNDQALMLPMFFLMVYLTLFIVDRMQALLLSSSSDPEAFTTVNYVIFIIIIMMLMKALKVAKEYSGELGNMIGGLTKSAATFVGGAALIGTVGRAASAIKSSETMQDWASKSRVGRGLMMGANATANASFGTKSAYGATLKATGLDKTSLKDQFKGTDKGYEGKKKDEMETDKKFAENFKGPRAGERRREYAEYLKGRGTGILGMTLKGAGALGIPGASSAAANLQRVSGRYAAGEDLIKKDKEIAGFDKKKIEEEQTKIESAIKTLETQMKAADEEANRLDTLNATREETAETRAQAKAKKEESARLKAEIAAKNEELKKAGKAIKEKEDAIKKAEDSETLKRLKDEIKKDEKTTEGKEEKESPKEEPKK